MGIAGNERVDNLAFSTKCINHFFFLRNAWQLKWTSLLPNYSNWHRQVAPIISQCPWFNDSRISRQPIIAFPVFEFVTIIFLTIALSSSLILLFYVLDITKVWSVTSTLSFIHISIIPYHLTTVLLFFLVKFFFHSYLLLVISLPT